MGDSANFQGMFRAARLSKPVSAYRGSYPGDMVCAIMRGSMALSVPLPWWSEVLMVWGVVGVGGGA